MEGYVPIEKYRESEAKSAMLTQQLIALQQESAQQIAALKFQLEQLQRMVFGAKSERYIHNQSPEQLSLFGQGADEKPPEVPTVEVPAHERKKAKRKEKPVRLLLPEHLEREEIVVEPEGIDTSGMVKIGEERTETLKYTPGKLSVKVTIRPKYAPRNGQAAPESTTIHIAELPPRFIEKCIAGETLLAAIITDKYVDHLPLYRIAARFERLGMLIPRSTLGGWIGQSAERLTILYNKLIACVLGSDYLQVDETRIEVLTNGPPKRKGKKPKKGKTHRGYLWGYLAVHEQLIFFDYDPSREAANPVKWLGQFDGTFQTDAYDVYDQIRKIYPDLRHFHCLNHSRREFEKALGNDATRAGHALEQFQLLYAVERTAREEDWGAEKIRQVRQEKSRPVLEALFEWMEAESPGLPPQSPIGKAMGYMLKRKDRMMHYLTDGRLLIDTNPIENAIRPIAVGRRNYLFAGSHDGAQRAAIFYSFFACCKMHGVDPGEWLLDIMQRLPGHPVNQIEQLLPHKWKMEKETLNSVGQKGKVEAGV